MLPHEQFIVPELANIGSHASQASFDLLASSDHFQLWQANRGHAAAAWITMAATCIAEPSLSRSQIGQGSPKRQLAEGGVVFFVDHQRRWRQVSQGRHQLYKTGTKFVPYHLRPVRIVSPPTTHRVFGFIRRDKARENRIFRMSLSYSGDPQQHSFEPRQVPVSAFSEEGLHVDAEVYRSLQRTEA